MAGKKFYNDEVKEKVTMWFKGLVADFYDSEVQQLVPRLNNCLYIDVDYVEKQICIVKYNQLKICK